jgi:hypothetical protein
VCDSVVKYLRRASTKACRGRVSWAGGSLGAPGTGRAWLELPALGVEEGRTLKTY